MKHAPPPKPRRSPGWLLVALAGASLLALVWLLWQAMSPRVPALGPEAMKGAAGATGEAVPPGQLQGEAPRGPGALPSQGDGDGRAGLWLEARLLVPGPLTQGVQLRGKGLVGPAFVSADDRRQWEEALAERAPGAGPARLEELANVREWLPAPVTVGDAGAGAVRLGPVAVPAAPRYRLLAWMEDGTFYWGDFFPAHVPERELLDAGALAATRPTGVRLRLVHARSELEPYAARLDRVVTEAGAERASSLWPVIEHLAPEVARALRGEAEVPLAVEGETRLAPLLPDRALRVRVTSAVAGAGEPVEIALVEGEVRVAEIDLARVFPGSDKGLVELHGRLRLGDTGRPPPEATLRWERGTGKEGAGDGGSQPVGRDGSFVVAGVPAWRPSHFVVMLPPPRRGRPLTPPQAEFDFVPSEGQGPGTRGRAEVTWRIPVYRWLVVRLDAAARFRIESPARAPYPQFLLERQDASGAWRARATDHFLSEAGGMAVSIAEPGRYRVIAAASPYLLYRTPEVEVADGDVEKAVELVFDGAA
ncbi:MAG TPA: hypothetical protein VH877_18720, partial [Polyangia bacterium]|nr:hypothetical protein [Polyangia bacterium]